ncbi:MAG: ATP-binding cassette domain-containing protein, partial [Verrucomicrobiota bacterium]
MSHSDLELPPYTEQSTEVSARFQRLKTRPVALEVRGIGKMFSSGGSSIEALRDISFDVYRREFTCVIGASGCGKSTLIRILAGLETASSGDVRIDGTPVSGPGADRGMVFQGYTLFPWLTVKRNVMFGLLMTGSSETRAESEAMQWIELVGLAESADTYPHQLSGGMKQRVAIARALANQPRIPDFNDTDTLQFKANDGRLDSNIATVTLGVAQVQDIPVAAAGPDEGVTSGELVVLNGFGSFDLDGQGLTFAWRQVSGP